MIQQFLLQFTGALNRRRAYAATHPMVRAAEERLLECARAVLATRESFTLGVARNELLIDGEPYVTKSTYARELASKLHRRGVGAITLERGLTLSQIAELLSGLAIERDALPFAASRAGGVQVTTIGYDHLVLNDSVASAEASVTALWRTLAVLAEAGITSDGGTGRVGTTAGGKGVGTGSGPSRSGSGVGTGTGTGIGTGSGAGIGSGEGPDRRADEPFDAAMEQAIEEAVLHGTAIYADGELTGVDIERVAVALRSSLDDPAVARRTATALAEVAASARGASSEARALIGAQLNGLLSTLGTTSFAPIIESLGDRSLRTRFVTDVAEVLPIGAVVNWIQSAASASGQQMSHQILRIMTKLSVLADASPDAEVESGFRDAARDLVRHWDLKDPNPTEHVELLDRIARFERTGSSASDTLTTIGTSVVETSRIVQMALELDFAGEDTAAAADALVGSGAGPTLLDWVTLSGPTQTANWLYGIATSERSVRQLLLTEPVDRLQARALLDVLDASSADVLLDVLEEAQARGTRMIVRQRLAEFGSVITPQLLARLESAPWFLVRNILTVLQEFDGDGLGDTGASLFALLEHPQVQVRTEALRLLILREHSRDAALRRALRDENERVVMLAIQSIADLADEGTRLSPGICTQLMSLVDAGEQRDPVRARAVRVVGTVRRDEIRDWLLKLVSKRTPFLRRLKLVEPTQAAAMALQVLQRSYASDPAAARVLALAARAAQDSRWQVRDVVQERVP